MQWARVPSLTFMERFRALVIAFIVVSGPATLLT